MDFNMDSKDAIEMLNLVAQQDDIRVAKILKTRWVQENAETYLWRINECTTCHHEMFEHDFGFVWGKPVTDDRDCDVLEMLAFCSEECVDRAIEAWVVDVKSDIMTAYFTDVG